MLRPMLYGLSPHSIKAKTSKLHRNTLRLGYRRVSQEFGMAADAEEDTSG